jgi:hypothetical protein
MVRLAQTAHLSCVKISTICKRTQTSFHLSLITLEYHRTRPKQFLSLWYVRCKPSTYIAQTLTLSSNGPKQDFTWPTHLGVPSGASKRFSSLWYDQHKPHTYLASRLALSPNGLKQASPLASSPRSIVRCVENDFWAYGMFSAKRAPILHWHQHCLQTVQNEIPHDWNHLGVPSGASKMISEPTVRSVQTMHLVKISTISKRTKMSFHLSLVT